MPLSVTSVVALNLGRKVVSGGSSFFDFDKSPLPPRLQLGHGAIPDGNEKSLCVSNDAFPFRESFGGISAITRLKKRRTAPPNLTAHVCTKLFDHACSPKTAYLCCSIVTLPSLFDVSPPVHGSHEADRRELGIAEPRRKCWRWLENDVVMALLFFHRGVLLGEVWEFGV